MNEPPGARLRVGLTALLCASFITFLLFSCYFEHNLRPNLNSWKAFPTCSLDDYIAVAFGGFVKMPSGCFLVGM